MTSKAFYRLLADPAIENPWFLKSPVDPSGREIDARIFTNGVPVPSQPHLQIPVGVHGARVGFNLAAFDMVVLPAAINQELQRLVGSSIQRIPVVIDEDDRFEILNVCELVECLDDSRSGVQRWTTMDGRPEKVGQYRMVVGLKIDGTLAQGRHIFRVAGWEIGLIVSDDVKRLFEDHDLTGVVYQRVD